jgi:hypothetical protein
MGLIKTMSWTNDKLTAILSLCFGNGLRNVSLVGAWKEAEGEIRIKIFCWDGFSSIAFVESSMRGARS